MNEPTTTRSKRDDLIRRGDVLNKVVRFPNYSENGESVDSYVVFDDDVMSIPAVDAVEVRHGIWERAENGNAVYYCSECHEGITMFPPTQLFCYHCGARMDGKEDHNALD